MTDLVPRAQRDPLARILNARAELEMSRDLAEVAAIKEFAVLAREYARAKKLGKEAIWTEMTPAEYAGWLHTLHDNHRRAVCQSWGAA